MNALYKLPRKVTLVTLGSNPAFMAPMTPSENTLNIKTKDIPNIPQTINLGKTPFLQKYLPVWIRPAKSSPIDARIDVFKNPIK